MLAMRKALKGATKRVEIEPPKSPAEKAAAAAEAAAACGEGEGGGSATGFDAAEGARGVSKLLPISVEGGEGDGDGDGDSGGGGTTFARYRPPPSGLPVVAEAGESAELSKLGTGSPQQLMRVTPTRLRLPTLPGVGEAAELGEGEGGIILEAASQY